MGKHKRSGGGARDLVKKLGQGAHFCWDMKSHVKTTHFCCAVVLIAALASQ